MKDGNLPPVPAYIREGLKDYPEIIQDVQRFIIYYTREDLVIPPFELAVWAIKDCLGHHYVEAAKAERQAEAGGNPEEIERAKKKRFAIGSTRVRAGSKKELLLYFENKENGNE